MKKERFLVLTFLAVLMFALTSFLGCGDDESSGTGTGTGTGTSTGTQTLTVKAFIHTTGTDEDGFIKQAYIDSVFNTALDPDVDTYLQRGFAYRLFASDGYNSHSNGAPDIAEFQLMMGGLNYHEENSGDNPRSRFDDSVMSTNDGEDHGLVSGHSVKKISEIHGYRAFMVKFSADTTKWGIYELDKLPQEDHTFIWTDSTNIYMDVCKGIQLAKAVPKACQNNNYKFKVMSTDGYYAANKKPEMTWEQFSTGWYKVVDGTSKDSKDKAFFDEGSFKPEDGSIRLKTPWCIVIIGTPAALDEAYSDSKPVLGFTYKVPTDTTGIANIEIKYTPH